MLLLEVFFSPPPSIGTVFSFFYNMALNKGEHLFFPPPLPSVAYQELIIKQWTLNIAKYLNESRPFKTLNPF